MKSRFSAVCVLCLQFSLISERGSALRGPAREPIFGPAGRPGNGPEWDEISKRPKLLTARSIFVRLRQSWALFHFKFRQDLEPDLSAKFYAN